MTVRISRRELVGLVGSGALATCLPAQEDAANAKRIKVAAIQMHSIPGATEVNLQNAEHWVRHAIDRGAKWIVLPEFFTSGITNLPVMLDADQPLDGKPTRLLPKLAREGSVYVGGSFLAEQDGHVRNTFVLATPDGTTYSHDKDFPSTDLESKRYLAGEDDEYFAELNRAGKRVSAQPVPGRRGNSVDGVFQLPDMRVGNAMCWELVRYRTAQRLRGKVDVILAASVYGTVDLDTGTGWIDRNNRDMLKQEMDRWKRMVIESPRRMARLVGAPVVHANGVGATWSKSTKAPHPDLLMRFLGHSQIVDGKGRVIAQRSQEEGEGVLIAEIMVGACEPSEVIPSGEFWTPEMTDLSKQMWYSPTGRKFYFDETLKHRTIRP